MGEKGHTYKQAHTHMLIDETYEKKENDIG